MEKGRSEAMKNLVLWHGAQRWSGPPEIRPAKSMKDVEYGPGFYLTTDVDVARSYAKGGGVLLRFELQPNLRWLDDARIPYSEMAAFVESIPRLRHKKEILADLARNQERTGKVDGAAAVVGNLMHYHEAVAGESGVHLVQFYLYHGIDADRVTGKGLRGDAEYVVLYNLDKIVRYERVKP